MPHHSCVSRVQGHAILFCGLGCALSLRFTRLPMYRPKFLKHCHGLLQPHSHGCAQVSARVLSRAADHHVLCKLSTVPVQVVGGRYAAGHAKYLHDAHKTAAA